MPLQQTAPGGTRNECATFRQQWQRAREIGPKFALVVSWNEWTRGKQASPEVRKNIEPSKHFGRFYLDLMTQEISTFKSGK